jgi:uncharacterized protein (DUF427 family)
MAVRVSALFPLDELRYEPTPKRVRGQVDGQTVVDSKRAWLVWEPGRTVPGWCFPREDVRMALLEPVEPRPDERTAPVGEVWHVGSAERAAWSFAGDAQLGDRIQISFYRLDRWLEEEDEVVGHPRDPFVRVDARRSSCRVRVELDGECLADSTRPLLVFETGLPVRYYLPREDVRTDLLTPSATRSVCAYKGHSRFFSAEGAEDIAWTYPDPLPDHSEIRDAIAFFNEDVDIVVDGERLERPHTKWSRSAQR